MAIIFDSIMYDLAVAVALLVTCLYMFFTSSFNYWKDRGVPYLEPLPFFGNVKDQMFGSKSQCDMYQDFYNRMKGEKYFGFFGMKTPMLMVKDPELVEKVLIKDFNHFYNRLYTTDLRHDPLTANLSNLTGKTWRNLRYKLTPTFTTGKLKGMFEQICNCGDGLVKFIEEETRTKKALEGKPLLSSFTLEVIASVAFGLQLDKDNEESKNFRKVLATVIRPNKLQSLRFFMALYMPKLAKKLGVRQIPTYVEDTVMSIVSKTLQYRSANNVQRNDFLQLLLNLQKQEMDGKLNFQKDIDPVPEDEGEDAVIDQLSNDISQDDDSEYYHDENGVFMTDHVIAAQSFVFLTAGLEPISSTISFGLYALSQNPEIQKRVHEEVDAVLARNNNRWSYQTVKEMVYLEQVIQETLRMYPVSPVLFRACTKPYKVPDSSLVIEKGVLVMVPVMAIHYDPQNYDSPRVFNPDRFQDNNFKPSGTYLPFGDGPRICIAMRFAALEVKIVLARILAKYTVRLSPKTKLPLTFHKKSFMLDPENSFWFEFDKRATT